MSVMSEPNEMKSRLKRAAESETVPPHLATRVRAVLEEAQAPRARQRWYWPALAMATSAVLLTAFLVMRRQENAYIAGFNLPSILRVGFGDHMHCTMLRKQRTSPKALEQMKAEVGPAYARLIPAVAAHVPANYQVLDAHKCHFQGREFIHLVMANGERYLSVVVARQQAGETFAAHNLVPALARSGIRFYQQGSGRFEVAGFESGQHLVYVVSDLPGEQNRQLMMAMAGDLRDALPAL